MQFDYETFMELMGLEEDPRMFRVYFPKGERDVAAEEDLEDQELVQKAYGDATRWQSMLDKKNYVPEDQENSGSSRVPGTVLDEHTLSEDGIFPFFAGERELDEFSPEMMGWDHQRPRLSSWWRESLPPQDPSNDPSPGEVFSDNTPWQKFKIWKEKRRIFVVRLKSQIHTAVLNKDVEELRRLYGVFRRLQDMSFEHRLLKSLLNLPPGVGRKRFKQACLSDDKTRDIYLRSRMLTKAQGQQLYRWFERAFTVLGVNK